MKHAILVLTNLAIILVVISCKDSEDNKTTGRFSPKAEKIENLQTLIISHRGVVEEEFFRSGDPQRLQMVNSVTKSVTATLIGIAIDKGLIESENETIGKYLEPIVGTVSERVGSLTIAQLLSLTAGAADELADISVYISWRNTSNQLEYIIENQFVEEPGAFAYNSGLTHMLSAIITQVSGQTPSEFAEENLFTPLGIDDHDWEMMERNLNNGGAGLQLSGPSMLKIGQLYLNKGIYNGERVLSESWIEKATTTHATTNTPFITPAYGYGFWIGNTSKLDYYMANGYGGQLIFVVPDLELIIVTTVNVQVPGNDAIDQATQTLRLIYDEIIPYYQSQSQ